MYAIGIAPDKLVSIEDNYLLNSGNEISKYITVSYDIFQSDCTLFNNKYEAEEILEDIKDEDNIVSFTNGNIFAGILDEFDETEPKIEDLKIYRIVVEEVE